MLEIFVTVEVLVIYWFVLSLVTDLSVCVKASCGIVCYWESRMTLWNAVWDPLRSLWEIDCSRDKQPIHFACMEICLWRRTNGVCKLGYWNIGKQLKIERERQTADVPVSTPVLRDFLTEKAQLSTFIVFILFRIPSVDLWGGTTCWTRMLSWYSVFGITINFTHLH